MHTRPPQAAQRSQGVSSPFCHAVRGLWPLPCPFSRLVFFSFRLATTRANVSSSTAASWAFRETMAPWWTMWPQ